MSRGGSTGPNRGGYFTITFSTQSLATASSSAGYTIGAWTVPTGARYGIVDVQAFCEYSGTPSVPSHVGRVNVLVEGTTALSSEISLASGSSTSGTLTARTVVATTGQTITATAAGGFGSGAASSAVQHLEVTITGFLMEHPNSIFGNFGYANPTTQPNFGP